MSNWGVIINGKWTGESYLSDTAISPNDVAMPYEVQPPHALWTGTEFVFNQQKVTDANFSILRSIRDRLLSESDWTTMAPISSDKKTKWEVYRQQLRDLPANTPDPENPTWPTPPQ